MTPRKVRPNPRARAAQLVAEDTLTDEQIAAAVGVSKGTLERWKLRPEFRARVAAIIETAIKRTESESINTVAGRALRYKRRAEKLDQVLAERADDPSVAAAAGGKTGLIVRQYKIANGREPIVREEFVVDTATLAEIRQLEKQAAQDLGQWSDKTEMTGKDGAPFTFTIQIDRGDSDTPSDGGDV
jgi:hypothetical protein